MSILDISYKMQIPPKLGILYSSGEITTFRPFLVSPPIFHEVMFI